MATAHRIRGVVASRPNVDPRETARFAALAARWWDAEGAFRALHEINPLRLRFVGDRTPLAGARVLDVGCGGGIFSEALARRGAEVTGLDAAEDTLEVARLHMAEEGLRIDYRFGTAEALAVEHPERYDAVACMELLEHVPDPASLVRACAELARPGAGIFFSTLNRTPKSFLLGIVAAEHVLELLPRGTHDYARFIRPSELDALGRDAGLTLHEVAGIRYNPLTRSASLGEDLGVNYLAWFVKE